MISIRLANTGAKKKPFYRIVVCDKRQKLSGSPIAKIGYFNPRRQEVEIDHKAMTIWISKGAKLSQTLKKLIAK